MWDGGCARSDVGSFQEKRFPFEHEVFRIIIHFNIPFRIYKGSLSGKLFEFHSVFGVFIIEDLFDS
jgi:hypothetical protein